MTLPHWTPFAVAVWVSAVGIIRIRAAIRKWNRAESPNDEEPRDSGRSALSSMTFGVVYLLLAGLCIAVGLGVQVTGPDGCAASPLEPEGERGEG